MSLNNAAVATADEPSEVYDGLSQTGQDVWDLIGSYGFRPDKDETDGSWYALSLTGDEKFGPCDSLSTLATVVEQNAKKTPTESVQDVDGGDAELPEPAETGKVVKLRRDHKGQGFIPGVEPLVDEPLKNAAFEFFTENEAWKQTGKKRTTAKYTLDAIISTKQDLFTPDPENSNAKVCRIGTLKIKQTRTVKIVTTVEQMDGSEDEE